MTKDQRALAIRARVKISKRKEFCSLSCPGWIVSHSDKYGVVIERCDECFWGLPDADKLTDDEAAALPEAQIALAAVLQEAALESGDLHIGPGGDA